mmetsp:Transcript_59042/g.97643  ORF Transcript_59042/g.97643 Transcript_59042/m.97643 type:complete len:209 (-) Transcript_59042:541-1167(-)
MKFDQHLRATVEASMPQWRECMLQYDKLKQAIKQMQQEYTRPEQASSSIMGLIDSEVDKVNEFYLERIEEAVIILHALQQNAEHMAARGAPLEQRTSCQRSLVSLHFNLLMLQNYVALNSTAVAKILKKFDKKYGTAIRSEYTRAIVELPFYRCHTLGHLVEESERLFQMLDTAISSVTTSQSLTTQPAGCLALLDTWQQPRHAQEAA